MKTLDLDEAAKNFMALLAEVDRGETVLITEHGKVIAKMVPIDDDARQAYFAERKEKMLQRLDRRRPWSAPRWTRDELHDDSPGPADK